MSFPELVPFAPIFPSTTATRSSRRYVFTHYFAEAEIIPELQSEREHAEFLRQTSRNELVYAIWQLERCPETGRLHYQGFLALNAKTTMGGIRLRFPQLRGHLEPSLAKNQDRAIEYCRKRDTRVAGPWSWGVPPVTGKGNRSDLMIVSEKIINRESMQTIALQHGPTYIRYNKGMEKLAQRAQVQEKTWNTAIIVFYGTPGSGKTFSARSLANKHSANILPPYIWMFQRTGACTWWDGYVGQEDVLIDEFANNFPFHEALVLLDNYATTVQCKGGTTNFMPKRIWITSMEPPERWYPNQGEHREALYRRLTHVYAWDGTYADDSVSVIRTKEPDRPSDYELNIPELPIIFRPMQRIRIDLSGE